MRLYWAEPSDLQTRTLFITSSFRQIILNAQNFFFFESKANSSDKSHERHQNQIELSVLSRWSVSIMRLRNGPPTRSEWTVIHASDTTHSCQLHRTKHWKNNFLFREDAVKRSLNLVDRSVETKRFGLKRKETASPFIPEYLGTSRRHFFCDRKNCISVQSAQWHSACGFLLAFVG